jgi:hypothetical protein
MRREIWAVAVAGLVLAAPASADTRDDVMAAMQRCSVIADDRTWLDCTYGAQQLMRAKLGLTPAPAYQQRLVPASPAPARADPNPQTASLAPAPVHRKGSFLQMLSGTAPPVAVSTLTAVEYDKRGAFVVTLQNGQVWRQANVESDPRTHLKVGSRVTISSGAMWTYNLKADDDPHLYKVER